MSKYTTELRFICETKAGLVESVGCNSVNDILNKSWDKIFDFNFPIFDEVYRKPLCIKILRHFYTREICEETVGLWKLRLEDRMNIIMPYYNKLYTAWQQVFNPLYDVDLTTTHQLTKKENSAGQSVYNGVARNLYSDTPQGSLQNVDNETYLTNATKDISDSTTNNTGNVNSTDDYIEHLTGKTAGKSYSAMLNEYRESIVNIDKMVIDELENLFMMIW